MITLGSLFDGAGTAPFAAQQYGVKTLWTSEIEPFPLRVGEKHFPEAIQLGDVSSIDGAKIKPVDIIVFGSPCQDLSVAGKRAGLEGERSGLFMQAVRIIKEMREATNGKYPEMCIWENVPGSFSSNKGEDFRFSIAWKVLDERYRGTPQRRRRIYLVLDLGGGSAGEILFKSDRLSRNFAESRESWQGITRSLACRADTAIGRGFEFIPIENHPADSRVTMSEEDAVQTLTSRMGTGGGNVPMVICMATQQGGAEIGENFSPTITAAAGMSGNNQPVICFHLLQDPIPVDDISPCLSTGNSDHGQASLGVCYSLDRASFNQGKNAQFDIGIDDSGTAHTLVAKGPNAVCYGICSMASYAMKSDNPNSGVYEADSSKTLDTSGANPVCNQGGILIVQNESLGGVYALQGSMIGREDKNGPQGDGINEDECFTLNTADRHAVAYGVPLKSEHLQGVIEATPVKLIVRRLTPTECARLQGMPDWWCDDLGIADPTKEEINLWAERFETYRLITDPEKKPKSRKQIEKWLKNPNSDSAEYKMWGNGMALPCIMYVLQGVVQTLTMRRLEAMLE